MTEPRPIHLHDALSALVDDQVSADERRAAQAHLAVCPACTTELAATTSVRALLRGLPPVDSPVPLDILALPRTVRRWTAGVAAAAAVAAVALLANVNIQPPPPEQVGRLVQVHTTSAVNVDPVSQMAPAAIPVSFQP